MHITLFDIVDRSLRWTAHTRADGSRIEFRYDRAGLKVATVDPLGHETLIERYDHGQVIAQTGPDGTRWAIERDALGQPVSIEGPDDQRWQIQRNELGHPLDVTGPEGPAAKRRTPGGLPQGRRARGRRLPSRARQ